ncbi:TaqI-like C-terminal specificity domain-containing protein [Parasutterella muris]|uniref:TaqI-like C-terminal specificity domain-containing protein n=1 Tax=Parasutterella muris TaxID=2565572 RepID=UPI00203BA49B|nr:TaqI-like C-terminal specificity domain-containing protein [Parasutterella muris]
MSVFVQQNAVSNNFATSDSWVILSPIERSIKRKIESIGTPLKDWDIRIYRGILTGCNEAFIISSQKRNEILANCANEAERQRTAELIRPILRGRDIKRYGYMDNGLYLINIHNGIRGRIPRIKIEDYPAVKAHLDQYWDKIEKRADQGDTPYNLRNCAYLEDFSKPKLFYPDISQNLTFALCQEKVFCNNTVYFFSSKSEKLLEYLASVLNTKLMDWYYRTISVQLGSCAVRMFSIYVLNLPVPKKVSGSLYETLSLTKEEIAFIESQ